MAITPLDQRTRRYFELFDHLNTLFFESVEPSSRVDAFAFKLLDLTLSKVHFLGAQLAKWAFKEPYKPWIFAFDGDLGSGKTALIKALATGLGYSQHQVQSPTFSYLMSLDDLTPLHHFDLYRLKSVKDFEELGFEEYLDLPGICCIEWAEKIAMSQMMFSRPHLSLKLQRGQKVNLRDVELRLYTPSPRLMS